MVYKRYIKRDGKTFGPYYYESYRDEKGRTRTKLVKPVNISRKNTLNGINKFSIKLLFILVLFSLFLAVSFVILNNNSEKEFSISSLLTKNNPSQVTLGNFIKSFLSGFQVSEEEPEPPAENAVPVFNENSAEQQEILEEAVPEIISDEQQTQENTSEIIIPKTIIEQNITIEAENTTKLNKTNDFQQNISEINQTKTIENKTSPQISSNQVTAQENISQINETLQNISEINQTILGENFTLNEKIVQYSAKLGEPVKWKKTLKIDAEKNKTINSLEVTLPKTAGEVSVKRILENQSIEELKVNVKNEKIISETKPIITITGQSIKTNGKISIFNNLKVTSKIFKFFKNFFVLIGRVVDIGENENEVLVNIQEELEDNDEIEIEYFTEAPYSEEIIFNENHKEINIVGSEEIHYENIIAFSNLSKEVLSKNEINLYWIKNNSKELIDFNDFDKDNNELIDYIEWIVPSLSNQTYEIILITKAQHLDSGKNFISDIYEQVKALDGNWSEQINDSEYVRVTFEKNLTNENDITIYPRTINGTPRIEVYENNKSEIIAEFTNIVDNEYNKVYLTKLNATQNTFDLKILGGSLEFEHIIDPFSGSGAGTLANPYKISNCTQLQEMKDTLAAHYKLVNNIDCSDTINWNGGAGFAPVGTNLASGSYFNGSLQGDDYNITELYIKNTTTKYVGMFGYAVNATINKVHLKNVYIEGAGLNVVVGGLVGAFDDNGTISNSSVHGNVTSKGGGGGTPAYTGGLAGWIWANKHLPTVYNSSFTGNISGIASTGIGGLVGWSDGVINYSFADVKLNTTSNNAGGLVGINDVDGSDTGIIDNSYSTGNVSATGSSSIRIGGLVGDNNANIYHSYSVINVSGKDNVGGLAGENALFISNSYSCGNVNGGTAEPAGSGAGGAIGFATSAAKTNYTYSAGIVKGVTVVGGFVGQDGTGAGGSSYYNFSFYDYEIDSGNYNDTGDNGNVSGIYANTTAQMKKQGTYTALGWDFTNIWQIAEDYSYPYFKYQTTPACGIPVPPVITLGGGSGNSPEIINLFSGFKVNPTTMKVILNQSQSKTECFTVTSTGTLSLTVNLKTLGGIVPYTTLTNSVLSIPVQNSKTACAVFSAGKSDVPENYTGQIEVSAKEKKYINVNLEIREPKIPKIGILPVGGILGLPTTEPIGILPIYVIFVPYGGYLGILPIQEDAPLIPPVVVETLVKSIGFISLWILLLLLVIIYLAVRRFVKLQDQLAGYESREEKLAIIERLKRESLRKEVNVFERFVDKGTIYLSEKKLGAKTEQKPAEQKTESKPIPSSLPAYATERYKKGAEFYSIKEYDKALKEFQKAVEVNNKFWQAWQGIGSCYLAKGESEKAKKSFEKCLSINPENEKLAEWMKKYWKK